MANALSNLAKRQAAISGRATTGDVPELYALQDAMAREGAARMGGTPGLGAGEGAGAPIPTGAGGGGAIGGQADLGLPGQGFANQDLERLYTRAFRSNEMMGGEGPDRGEIASRGPGNISAEDPYGLEFGQGIATGTQIAGLLGVPFMGMANTFVNLMLQDAQMKQDAFIEGVISGDLPTNPAAGATITRSQPTMSAPNYRDIRGQESGVGISAPSEAAAAEIAAELNAEMGLGAGLGDGGGDAGSGGGGGGAGTGGCFVAGTAVTMADGSEKPIEEIQLGDKVTAFDGDTGEIDTGEVVALFSHLRKRIWVLNDRTYCTPIHRFWAKFGGNGWGFWPLEEIPIGARLMDAAGNEVVAETIQDTGREQTVYNFEVDRLHTYVSDGYRVHNAKHQGGYIDEGRVPGQNRGDVDETLQEGEYVIRADVVDMLGPQFFDGLNNLARLAKKGRR